MRTVERDEVQQLAGSGEAQLAEVLPAPEYEWAHLPGALSLPLRELSRETVARLDRRRPVIAYCQNQQCDLSPRAVSRLGQLGFAEVYDYAAGKLDWLAAGLPHEGSALLAGDVMVEDVPTCGVYERVEDVGARMLGRAFDLCVVLDDEQVVQGVVDNETLEKATNASIMADATTFGVPTVRPSEDVDDLLERMRRADAATMVVTSADAQLLGVLVRVQAEAIAAER
ncbi:rhodanese-like domain-containing protein [Flindersiella endophytica]